MVLSTIMQCAIISATTPQTNAADAWQEFFVEFDNYEFPYIEHEDGFETMYYLNEEWSDESHAIRMQITPLIDKARSIASNEQCDWQLDYSEGFDLLVPHLTQLREVQRMLHYSMRGELDFGNTSAALTEMNAMLGITQHSAKSDLLIGSLVAYSNFIFATTDTSIIDSATDPKYVEAILTSVDNFGDFDPFGIRRSIGAEGKMMVGWFGSPKFDAEILRDSGVSEFSQGDVDSYEKAMDEMSTIFQMENQEDARVALLEWDLKVEKGEFGVLAKLLAPAGKQLLESAFTSEERVATFKQLLQDKIAMLRAPNSAMYYLQAVESYNVLDADERVKAIEQGDFTVLEEPLSLFAKACSMPVTQITLSESPETPSWVAPLYSLALDCLARGGADDQKNIVAFIGHMSVQNRFASSIVAGKLFEMIPSFAFTFDINKVPVADAFSLHGSARSDRERLKEYFEIEGEWSPSNANVLAMTLTIANEKSVPDANPMAWQVLVEAMKIPDDDPIVEALLEEWMPESLEDIELKQETSFNKMLKELKTKLATIVQSIRSRGR